MPCFPGQDLSCWFTVFGTDDKENLTAAERNAVKAMLTKYEAQLK